MRSDTSDMGTLPADSQGSVSYESSSPLILALLSVLTRLSQRDNREDVDEHARKDSNDVSQWLAQCALEAVSTVTGSQSAKSSPLLPSSFHPRVPQELEMPLACCVLSYRQYLFWGDVDQMTLLAQKAFGLFGDATSDPPLYGPGLYAEASRRAWWMTVRSNSTVCSEELSVTGRVVLVSM